MEKKRKEKENVLSFLRILNAYYNYYLYSLDPKFNTILQYNRKSLKSDLAEGLGL